MRLWRGFGLAAVVLWPTLTVGNECITLESFASSREGLFPEGWFSHAEAGRSVYRVHVEPGGRFVRASAKGVGIPAHLHRTWSLEDYPVLAWKWRPREFPVGAYERERGRNDSVLGVYVLFSSPWGAVKYIWSEKLPRGAEFEVGFLGRTKVVVVESGDPPIGVSGSRGARMWRSTTSDASSERLSRRRQAFPF